MRIALADGRSAVRRIARPDDLLETLTAVLVLPRRAQTAQEPESSSSIAMPVDLPVADPELTPDAKPPPLSVHLEVGGGAAARLSGAPAYAAAGASAFAHVLLDRWLLGVGARWDVEDILLSAPPSGFKMHTLALGVGLGFRQSIGSLNLDATIGPEMLIESQDADRIEGDAIDVRLELRLRLSGSRHARTRLYAAGDIDASPLRMAQPKQIDQFLPPLPSWSSGLTLGVMWSAF